METKMNRECDRARDVLSRFLDNDLPGRDATRLVAHLTQCVGCRHEYDRLQGVKTALHLAPVPAAPESVRTRVLAHVEQAQTAPVERATIPHFWWHPLAATFAAATAAAAFWLFPGPTNTASGLPPVGVSVAAGQDAELTALFDLHDARVSHYQAADPILHRSEAADSHAAQLAAASTEAEL